MVSLEENSLKLPSLRSPEWLLAELIKCNTFGEGIANAGDGQTTLFPEVGSGSWSLTGVGAMTCMKGATLVGVRKRAGLVRATAGTTASVESEVVFTRPRAGSGAEIIGIFGLDWDKFLAGVLGVVEGELMSCRLFALLLLLANDR
jgi:hypothetical protein